MIRPLLALLILSSLIGNVFGQADGDYRSKQTGNWNQSSTWEVFFSGSWHDATDPGAGAYQNTVPTASRGVILISSSTTITIPSGFSVTADQLQFGANAVLEVASGGTLIVNNGTGHDVRLYYDGSNNSILRVAGTLRLNPSATIVNDNYAGTAIRASHPSLFNTYKVLDGGTHIHYSSDQIPSADWQDGSTMRFVATNANPVINDLTVQFYNFIWDGGKTIGSGQSANLNFSGRLRNVRGNLSFIGTNSTRSVYLGSNHSYTLNVGGDVFVNGSSLVYFNSIGTVVLNIGSISSPSNLEVTSGVANLNLSGSTTINVFGNFISSGGTTKLGDSNNTDLNIYGDYIQTAGTVSRTSTGGSVDVNFVGTGTTSFFNRSGGTISGRINYTVANGKTLDFTEAEYALVSTGSFTLASGGTLMLRSLDSNGALQGGTSGGNIQVSGTRTYQSGSTIVYAGSDAQVMGGGHPPAPDVIILNSEDVNMISNVTINGDLTLGDNNLVIGNNTLTLGGTLNRVSGAIGAGVESSVVVNGSGEFGDLVFLFTDFTDNPIKNLTINRSAGTVYLGSSLTVGGDFRLLSGNFSLGQYSAYTLTLMGNFVQNSGATLSVFDLSRLVISGSGNMPTNVNITGPNLFSLTMDRPNQTFRSNSDLLLTELNLFNGTVNNTSLRITMADNGIVTRESGGAITSVLGAQSTFDVVYNVDLDITTGNELPFTDPGTRLGNLIKEGPGQVILNHPIRVNKSFIVREGTFSIGNFNDVEIAEDLIVNGTLLCDNSKIALIGSGPQTIDSTPLSLLTVEINQSGGSTVTLSDTTFMEIHNLLTIQSPSTFNVGDNQLTLRSSSIRTANVGPLPAGAEIDGSVIVQRFLSKVNLRRQYHYMASPVLGATLADWEADMPIGRAYRWDESAQIWRQLSSGSPLTNGQGFIVDVNSTGRRTADVRGPLAQGNITVPLTFNATTGTSKGMNLIGNPYASTISWENIAKPPAVDNAVYLIDNFNNSGQGNGTEITISYADGVGTPSWYDGTIAPGQAFYVFATGNTSLTFTESAKVPNPESQFFRQQEIPNVLRIVLKGQEVEDEAVIRLRDGASDNFDSKYDAHKLPRETPSISSITADNIKAVINAIGVEECNKSIALSTDIKNSGTYSLVFNGLESFDTSIEIELIDAVAKSSADIRDQNEYTFTVTNEDLNLTDNRFQIVIRGGRSFDNTIIASGETICADDNSAIITLERSEPGVEYFAESNGTRISDSAVGSGALLTLQVDASHLVEGENILTIKAQSGVCATGFLASKPVVTKASLTRPTLVSGGVVCHEGVATLKVSGAPVDGAYRWYESEDSATPIQGANQSEFVTPHLVKTKSYYVSTVNGSGCESPRVPVNVVISRPEPVDITLEGTTLVSSAGEGNQWYLNGQKLEGATGNSLTIIEPGLYAVETANGGCVSRNTYPITELSEDQLVTIYPNPAIESVRIRVLSKSTNVSARLINMQGTEMETRALEGEQYIKETEFDVKQYSAGIYNLIITDGSRIFVKKFAKKE